MSEFFDFIKLNYSWLISVLLSFISLIVLIFKRKIKVFDYISQLILVLPDYINEAENQFSYGKDKFTYVFSKSVVYLAKLCHCSEEKVISKYGSVVNQLIEDILTTPQKKKEV